MISLGNLEINYQYLYFNVGKIMISVIYWYNLDASTYGQHLSALN